MAESGKIDEWLFGNCRYDGGTIGSNCTDRYFVRVFIYGGSFCELLLWSYLLSSIKAFFSISPLVCYLRYLNNLIIIYFLLAAIRDQVIKKLLSLRPPALVDYPSASIVQLSAPTARDMFKKMNYTRRWVRREISNFGI